MDVSYLKGRVCFRHRRQWKNNIKMDLKKAENWRVDGIPLALNKEDWQALGCRK
jgi:hypothetical protein